MKRLLTLSGLLLFCVLSSAQYSNIQIPIAHSVSDTDWGYLYKCTYLQIPFTKPMALEFGTLKDYVREGLIPIGDSADFALKSDTNNYILTPHKAHTLYYSITNPSGYISANQNITLLGDVTGSGTTSIVTTLSSSGVTANTYTYATITVDAKGRVTAASSGSLAAYATIADTGSFISSKTYMKSYVGIELTGYLTIGDTSYVSSKVFMESYLANALKSYLTIADSNTKAGYSTIYYVINHINDSLFNYSQKKDTNTINLPITGFYLAVEQNDSLRNYSQKKDTNTIKLPITGYYLGIHLKDSLVNYWQKKDTNAIKLPITEYFGNTNYWGLNGTFILSTNFIGSTNNQPVIFRQNNRFSGEIGKSSTLNTLFGYGGDSVFGSATNIASFGYLSLAANTANGNSAFGSQSLKANTTGFQNTGIGDGALSGNTTQSSNTAVGLSAMSSSNGNGNTAIGNKAGGNGTNCTWAGDSARSNLTNSYTLSTALGAFSTITANDQFTFGTTSNLHNVFWGDFNINGSVGSTGQYLISGGSGVSPTWKTVTTIDQASPTNPTQTTSASFVMMGLAGSLTTSASGNVFLSISGTDSNSTGGDGIGVELRYGTGTAPTNGAAATGTLLGKAHYARNSNVAGISLIFNAGSFPFTILGDVSGLTANTAYWIDVAIAVTGGGTAYVYNTNITAHTLP